MQDKKGGIMSIIFISIFMSVISCLEILYLFVQSFHSENIFYKLFDNKENILIYKKMCNYWTVLLDKMFY